MLAREYEEWSWRQTFCFAKFYCEEDLRNGAIDQGCRAKNLLCRFHCNVNPLLMKCWDGTNPSLKSVQMPAQPLSSKEH